MNGVLADTSVWIAYLKGRPEDKRVADALDYLLSGDEAVVNREPKDYTLWRENQFNEPDETIEELGQKIMDEDSKRRRRRAMSGNKFARA